MAEENLTIGKRLNMLRQQNRLTQEMLADKLSISRQSVSKWETDAAVPDLEKLVMLSDIYQVSIDFLVRGEPAAEEAKTDDLSADNTDTNNSDTDNSGADIAAKNTKPTSAFMPIALLISGVFGLVSLILTINLWFHFALFSDGKNQDIMTVTKIYEQYTKAEVQGIAEDGKPYSSILWLDRQGVAEDDLLWAYVGDSGHIRVPYYNKTVLIPLLCTVLFWLLFLLCFWRLKDARTDKKGIVRMAVVSLIPVVLLLAIPVVLVLFRTKPEEKEGSRQSGQTMQQETDDASISEKDEPRLQPAEETFALTGFGISLNVPLPKDFYVQGSYIGDDYHSIQLSGRENGAWVNCNLHKSNEFYKNALDYMMIQLENAKEWDAKWAGREIELQTVNIDGRVCYFYEAHYKYDGSDIQNVVGACDVDDSHFIEVNCEGLDYDGTLNFDRIKEMFYFQ